MTVTVTAARARVKPVAVHAYSVPVVRELPSQPVELCDRRVW